MGEPGASLFWDYVSDRSVTGTKESLFLTLLVRLLALHSDGAVGWCIAIMVWDYVSCRGGARTQKTHVVLILRVGFVRVLALRSVGNKRE